MDRPFVHINLAATVDGKIDTVEGRGAAISSPLDKERVDRLRARADAVMVGGHTLHAEDPRLTVKSETLQAGRIARGLPPHPSKVGVSSSLHLKPESGFLRSGHVQVYLFTTPQTPADQLAMLEACGAKVFIHPGPRVDLNSALATLKQYGIHDLMVEGGGALNFELMRLGLVDEMTIYIAPMIFGGAQAPTIASGAGLMRGSALPVRLMEAEPWEDGGLLLRYKFEERSYDNHNA